MDLSTLAAQNRIQAELLRMAQQHRFRPNAATIEPIPVHTDIASRVSTTRETVARVLNDLARKGIVERSKGALVIHDLKRLTAMVSDVRG
ncbi:MAG: winged helix-turn-helix domain-containing protein [Rhodospirillales bacterium]|nr:winged helix-turn-helix domain-containing protein [Rhodospirillales bacterium]